MRFHHMGVVTTDIDRVVRCGSSRTPMGFDVAVRMSIPDGDDFGPDILAPRKLRNHQRASAFTTYGITRAFHPRQPDTVAQGTQCVRMGGYHQAMPHTRLALQLRKWGEAIRKRRPDSHERQAEQDAFCLKLQGGRYIHLRWSWERRVVTLRAFCLVRAGFESLNYVVGQSVLVDLTLY